MSMSNVTDISVSCDVQPSLVPSPVHSSLIDEDSAPLINIAPCASLAPDIEHTRKFLKIIDPHAEEHFFQTFGDGRKSRTLVSQRFASIEALKGSLTRLNEAGAGIFVTINKTNGTGRAAKDITGVRALYVDFDDKDSARDRVNSISKKLLPSMVVESSPGLFHVYFLVTGLALEDAALWLRHLIAVAGSDPACKDISRVLRLPGFFHRKREPFMTRIVSIANNGAPNPYTVAELAEAFGCPAKDAEKVVNKKTVSKSIRTSLASDSDRAIVEGGRNSTLASLAGTMRYRGMSQAAINAALHEENSHRCKPPLDNDEVTAIATSIASYPPSDSADSLTGETPEQVISRLAALGAIAYDQVRTAEAKGLRVRPSTLDKMVSIAKGDDTGIRNAPFTEVSAWPTPVDIADILTEIVAAIHRQIVCESETAVAAALWVVMTYLGDQFDIAPLAVITAPEPRCGKSVLRRLLQKIVFRAVPADGMSAAVLFRVVDRWSPTLLIDEYDTFIKDDEGLRGVFNAGHERGGMIWRCVGEDHEPTGFNAYGPKLLAGIGKLPPTITDRSIQLELRRKLPTETVIRERDVEPDIFVTIQQKLMRVAEDFADGIGAARPQMPSELNDRQQDNWEPLFQIAEFAGGEWPDRAKRSALQLSKAKDDVRSRRIELLADIKDLFETSLKATVNISTGDLIMWLCRDSEMSWATYNRGQPLSPRQLAKLLKDFGISSGSVRFGTSTAKGYQKSHFNDVFARYL